MVEDTEMRREHRQDKLQRVEDQLAALEIQLEKLTDTVELILAMQRGMTRQECTPRWATPISKIDLTC